MYIYIYISIYIYTYIGLDQLFSWGLNIEAFMYCRYLSITCRYLTYRRKIDMVWSGCV